MLPDSQLRTVLPTLSVISLPGPWARVIAYRHLVVRRKPKPLWAGGASKNGARFTLPGGPQSLYLASDPATALTEVRSIILHPSAPLFTIRMPPQVVVSIDGVLTNIIDLTDPAIQSALGTTHAELTGLWKTGSPTQVLGQAAFDAGNIVGFKYDSAVNPPLGTCVVVFPDRVVSPSWLEVYDPDKKLVQSIP